MNFYLYVIDTPDNSQSTTMEYVLDYGPRKAIITTHRENRQSGLYPGAQFYVTDESGLIVAIEAHENLLWLERVPPPDYWKKPKPEKRTVGGLPVPERFCSAGVD